MATPLAFAAPSVPGERLLQLDVLRGLAIFGVLMVIIGYFCGADLALEAGLSYSMGWGGERLYALSGVLLEGKAAALLAILFGAGLAIQHESGVKRGVSGLPFALRRTAALALIGTLHTFLLSNIDILLDYAVISLLVLPFLRLSAGRILWAIPLVLLAAGLISAPALMFALDLPAAEMHELNLAHYGQGSWFDALEYRIWETVAVVGPMRLANRLVILAPFFIVGVAAWKSGLLLAPAQHRRTLVWVFVLCFGCGLVANLLPQEDLNRWANQLSVRPLRVLIKASFFLAKLCLTFGYAAGVLLLLQHSMWRRCLAVMAPLGRMALTQYLLQSVICTTIFYGFGIGLYGKLPMIWVLLLGVSLFALQVIASWIWLAHFRLGPVEWVWRRLSYGRATPTSAIARVDPPEQRGHP
ncbi:MAG: DUF418 domain-containing protein [Dokdonella sp.]